jgi:DNA-binding transcriptional ArsR family regulator
MPIESSLTAAREETSVCDELLGFFRALADQSRLRAIGLLAQQPYTVEQLSALLGISESTVSHHLARLSEAGLVSARAEGHYSLYSLNPEVLSRVAHRLLETDCLPELASGIDLDTFDKQVLARFTDSEGRFTGFPSQERKLRVLLRHVARDFRPGARYDEKKVEAILSRHTDDTIRLRDGLVECGLLTRERGEYRVGKGASA